MRASGAIYFINILPTFSPTSLVLIATSLVWCLTSSFQQGVTPNLIERNTNGKKASKTRINHLKT